MPIVGPDGQTPVSSEAEQYTYKVGGIHIASGDTPEMMLQKALMGAQQMVAQQVGAMSLQRTGSHVIAQTEAQTAAAKVSNPFQLEPCALGMFMLMAREIEHRDAVISALATRLDALDGKSSEELLKKPWPVNPVQEQENEGENDEFSQAVENLSKGSN